MSRPMQEENFRERFRKAMMLEQGLGGTLECVDSRQDQL